MPPSMTHSMLTGHPRWFENQTKNRPPDRVNSTAGENGPLLADVRESGQLSANDPARWRVQRCPSSPCQCQAPAAVLSKRDDTRLLLNRPTSQ